MAAETAVRRRIAEAVAAERERIAHDLHDTVGGLLTAAHILSSDLAGQRTSAEQAGTAERVAAYTAEAMEQIRAVCHALPAPLDVAAELRAVAAHADGVGGVRCILDVAASAALPEGADGRDLVLLVREAVGNALRHARARTIGLSVDRTSDGLLVQITDDGVGFAPGTVGGLGLATMHSRARRLGATLTIQSTPGAGTTVRLFLPSSSHSGSSLLSPRNHV